MLFDESGRGDLVTRVGIAGGCLPIFVVHGNAQSHVLFFVFIACRPVEGPGTSRGW